MNDFFLSRQEFATQCDSTNTVLSNMFKDNSKYINTVLRTDFQTDGVGQRGNYWESKRGDNLLFSIGIIDIDLLAEKQFYLSIVTSLSIVNLLKKYISNEEISIKWPNDIYVNKHKISGILIENSLNGNIIKDTIIGVGININQSKFLSNAPNPISLKQLKNRDFDLNILMEEFLYEFQQMYSQLVKNEYEVLKSNYLQILYQKDELHEYIINEEIIQAVIIGVDKYGFLELQSKNKLYTCDIKNIKYI